MRFSYVAAGAWAIFLGIGSIGSGGLFSFAVLSPLWILPLWLVHRSATKKQQQLKAYVAKFLTTLGHNDQRLFYLSPISEYTNPVNFCLHYSCSEQKHDNQLEKSRFP